MNEWENIFGEPPASFEDRVQSTLNGLEEHSTMKTGRGKKTRGIVLVAVAAAALLGVGVYAAVNRSVQELVLQPPAATETASAAIPETPGGTEAPRYAAPYDPLSGEYEMISLQGYAGSAAYQAALEWAEFLHGYDTDGSLLAAVGNGPTGLDARYNSYGVYTQEAADALDAIAEKYGLVLHGEMTGADMEELYARFGKFADAGRWGGYYYDDGTFQFDGDGYIGGYHADYQFRRTMKNALDTVYLSIGDAESYEQWSYETACGETVLLALGPTKALIFAYLEDCFVAVNVLSGTETPDVETEFGSGPLTAEVLEALADSFDFSIL